MYNGYFCHMYMYGVLSVTPKLNVAWLKVHLYSTFVYPSIPNVVSISAPHNSTRYLHRFVQQHIYWEAVMNQVTDINKHGNFFSLILPSRQIDNYFFPMSLRTFDSPLHCVYNFTQTSASLHQNFFCFIFLYSVKNCLTKPGLITFSDFQCTDVKAKKNK